MRSIISMGGRGSLPFSMPNIRPSPHSSSCSRVKVSIMGGTPSSGSRGILCHRGTLSAELGEQFRFRQIAVLGLAAATILIRIVGQATLRDHHTVGYADQLDVREHGAGAQ